STIPAYLGVKALLAVEDNGEGSKAPDLDKFTWGVYRTTASSWVPVDAEDPNDIGATLSWTATDFERPEDTGVSSNATTAVDCKSFPFDAYAFEAVPHGGGNLQVKP
ncbi:MAG: hypothetical protein ACLGH0_10790, partial [Thermoanaerobaculia bacterium]